MLGEIEQKLPGLNNALRSPLPIANGGTGQSAASAAFNALSPMASAGDIIYGGVNGAGTRLAAGSNTQVLIGGTTPSWGAVALGGSMVSGTLGVGNGGTGTGTSFTQGSVVFAGSSGVYSQNNASLFWDNTNDRLGVGTASPARPLAIQPASGDAVIGINNSSGTERLFIGETGGAGNFINNAGASQAFMRTQGTVLWFGIGSTGQAAASITATGIAVGGGNVTTPTAAVDIGGQSTQKILMDRETTSNTAGNSLTVQSGGATSGATDKASGDLLLAPGVSTGQGGANVRIQTMTRALSSGTGDNTATDRVIAVSPKSVTNSSATTVASFTVANGSVVGATASYAIEVTDGTDYQCEVGLISFNATNKAGTIANNGVNKSNSRQSLTTGTLTVTWSFTAANPALLQLTATSSLTPSTGYPRVTFVLNNLTQQAVTIS